MLCAGAVSIGEPNATIRAEASRPISEEGNDAIWEEIGARMRQDTNPSFNFVAPMALSGAVAAFEIVSDTIQVVVGAMLIAPGFEPLLRFVLGVMGDRHSVTAGLRANAYGFEVSRPFAVATLERVSSPKSRRDRRCIASSCRASASWHGTSTARSAELQVRIAILNGYTALGIPVTEAVTPSGYLALAVAAAIVTPPLALISDQ